MTRKIWQGDFASLWFSVRPSRKAQKPRSPAGDDRQDSVSEATASARGKPLGIVERNRLARREKWALRLRD